MTSLLLAASFSGMALMAAPGPPIGHCEGCPAVCWECVCPGCPPPIPCDSCCEACPTPECRERDGSNQRFCGIHDYASLMAEHGIAGDGGSGMVFQFADPISGIFLCMTAEEPYVDFWDSRELMLDGEPPVLTWPPWPDAEPWCGGVAFDPNYMRAMRLRDFGKMEDFVYE